MSGSLEELTSERKSLSGRFLFEMRLCFPLPEILPADSLFGLFKFSCLVAYCFLALSRIRQKEINRFNRKLLLFFQSAFCAKHDGNLAVGGCCARPAATHEIAVNAPTRMYIEINLLNTFFLSIIVRKVVRKETKRPIKRGVGGKCFKKAISWHKTK